MTNLRASIDIGSNSVLLLVGDISNGKLREISKRSEITSLGRDLDATKNFHSESMEATYQALESYAKECDHLGIQRTDIIATATEASRVAANASVFFAKVEHDLKIKVNIITSQAEAYFSSKGILNNGQFRSEIITIMDIGGASTELIRVNTKTFQVLETISMPIGAVRATQWLDEKLFVQRLQKVFLDFRNEIDKFQTKELYCVAGTVTSLGNMHLKNKEFIENEVHGLVLKAEDVDALFKTYSEFSPKETLELFPFLKKRTNSIRGGLHLVYHLAHRLMVKELTISTYGLRFGTLLEGEIKKQYLYGQ